MEISEVSSLMKEVFSLYVNRNLTQEELSENLERFSENVPLFILNTVKVREYSVERLISLYKRYINSEMPVDLIEDCKKRMRDSGLTYPDYLSETLVSDKFKSSRGKHCVMVQISDSSYSLKSIDGNKEQVAPLGWDFMHYMYFSKNKSFEKFIKINSDNDIVVCIDGKYKLFTYAFIVLLIDVLFLTHYTRFTFYDKNEMFMIISKDKIGAPIVNFDFKLSDVSRVCVQKI